MAKEDATFSEVLAQPSVPVTQKHQYGSASEQFYLRWQQADEAPLLVFIHGGCWLDAFDIEHARPLLSALYEAGFTVIGVEYRRTTDDTPGWPVAKNDVLKALGQVVAETVFDTTRPITIVGHSAGGHLALLAATQASHWGASYQVDVHGLAAIVDIVQYAQGSNSCQQATERFMGGSYQAVPLAYQAASPLSYAMPDEVNVTLWHGAQDQIVPLSQADYPNALLQTEPHAGHFAWIHPQTTAYNNLLKYLLERAL